jgi:hypothetical protein
MFLPAEVLGLLRTKEVRAQLGSLNGDVVHELMDAALTGGPQPEPDAADAGGKKRKRG